MTVSKDTDSLYSPRARDIQREYQQWNKAHQRIKNSPAQEGRDYVRHARNLLPILEGLAELHPIAKGDDLHLLCVYW
jgi:Lon protease-like protein